MTKEEFHAVLKARAKELEDCLAHPEKSGGVKQMATLGKEYGKIREQLALFDDERRYQKELFDIRETLEKETDEEFRTLAEQERKTLEKKYETVQQATDELLHPSDPLDEKEVIVEIRAGTGGDEAAIFASDLFRMYQRYAERERWTTALIAADRTTRGGFKEIAFEVNGKRAYRTLKYESGVHRVQRIPETEKSGRIHTSTATVAILPKVEEQDIAIDPKDLLIETSTAQGHGGQSVNTTYSAIKLTHLPTGITVSCQDERSQRQNKEKAMSILRARVFQFQQEKKAEEERATRRSQIGGAKRAEKIRTYNFPQDRVTDHRINENFHNLSSIMDGNLDALIAALQGKLK